MRIQLLLAVAGLGLFLGGIALKLLADLFWIDDIVHGLGYNLNMAMTAAARGDIFTATPYLRQSLINARQLKNLQLAQVYLIATGAMLAIPLWLAPHIHLNKRLHKILACFLTGGGIVLATAEIMKFFEYEQAGRYVSIGGVLWLFLGIGGYFFYAFLRYWQEHSQADGREKC